MTTVAVRPAGPGALVPHEPREPYEPQEPHAQQGQHEPHSQHGMQEPHKPDSPHGQRKPQEPREPYAQHEQHEQQESREPHTQHERDHTIVVRTAVLHVREATAEDLPAVNDLHRRCSITTLCSRYHAGRDRLSAAEWSRMVDPLRGHTLVLATEPNSLIGFANVLRTEPDGTAEVSMLLHDDWQGIGVGRAMTTHLLRLARRSGFAAIVAWTEPDNHRAVSLLRGTGAVADLHEPGLVRWRLHLR